MSIEEKCEKTKVSIEYEYERKKTLNSQPQDKIKNFLEEQCEKYNLGKVKYTSEDPYYDLEPVFIIKNSKSIPFEKIDSIWDELTRNTEIFSENSGDEQLTKFFHECFIILE